MNRSLSTPFLVFSAVLFLCVAAGRSASSDSSDEPAFGEISGRIVDVQTGAPLSDVNIIVFETSYGGASAPDGTFLINRIPPGTYTLRVSRIGYQPKTIPEVIVKPGRLAVKQIKLASTVLEFDEVVMSASRREQTANMAPASVSMIKSAEIQQRNATTFDQVLETVPGVSIQRTMGVSVQSLSLRGSSDVAGGGVGNRVLLAIDGRPALSSDSGGALWSLVPTNFIDRIEIVKGAFSSLYGSTAMGGVVNVITKKPAYDSYFKINTTAGFYEPPPQWMQYKDGPSYFSTIEFNHSNHLGKVSYLLSLSRKQSQGHRERSAFEFYNLYGKAFIDLSNNRNLEVTVGGDLSQNDYPHTWFSNLEPLKVASKYQDDVQNKSTLSADVFYYAIPSPRVKYSSRFYMYRNYFKSEFNPNDPTRAIPNNEPYGLSIEADSRKLGNISQVDYFLSDRNYLIAGIDLQRDIVDSSPDSILYGNQRVNTFAVYAQDEHDISDKLTFNAGVRYDFNKLEGGKLLTQLSPKASLVYKPKDIWAIRFLVGRAFRAPSIAERFFKKEISGGTSFKPNPDLQAEKVTSLEIGNRIKIWDRLDLDLAVFHNIYEDMIYWIDISAEEGIGGLYQVRNLNKARMQGVEIGVNVNPINSLNANLNYTYLDAKDLSDERRDGFLAYKVRHSFNFITSVQHGPWFLNVDGRYNSKVQEVFLYPNDKPGAFFVISGKLRRHLGQNLTVSLGVNNIFDVQYEELARYRMPGRTWIFGSSFEF